ncbi:sodium:solute symporter family protein [Corynebacterium propinquum]|uniref:sodium:solute symporter family protein n=1 Tax=Corynebacterium TaxID=1716 RepID=UPI002543B4AC|nr:sodium:solute symporter family protein [Corynebacterium propinquum]MDK4238374.1 sodium:solute symporter family protein [Corynebacterium propinquum]
MINVIVCISYLALMIAISAWFSRKKEVNGGEDFVIAGQSLPSFVVAGTLLTTFVGSGSIIGGASFAFQNGPLTGIFFFLGTLVGALILGIGAKTIRRKSFHTVPELLRSRFGRPASVLGTILVLLAFIGIAATQFTGAGYIFSLITPLSASQGTIISLFLITFIAMSGGLKSVAWTDFLSALLIIIGLLLALAYIFIQDFGGFGSYVDRLEPSMKSVTGNLTALQILGFFLPTFLLCLGDQNMHQRLAAAKSENSAQRATIFFFIGGLFIIAPVILLASAASIINPDSDPDMAVLGLAAEDFTPTGVGAIILAAALALVITTGSSYLLTCSGNVVFDLLGQHRNKKPESTDTLDAGQQLRIARVSVIVIAILGYVLSSFFPTFLSLQMYAYTVYGAALTPVIWAALFWSRASRSGAITSMIVGVTVTIGWEIFGEGVNSVVVALPFSVAALVVISLCTKSAPMDAISSDSSTSTQKMENASS